MKHFIILLFLLSLLGCGSLQEEYVEADRQTYEVVAPQIEKWLQWEPALTLQDQDAIEDWHRKLRSWKFRIEKAEKAIAEEKAD